MSAPADPDSRAEQTRPDTGGGQPTIHGTAIALASGDCWNGLLLRGPSGAGKSSLAARMIDRGARLLADDRVILEPAGNELLARCPESLSGLLELRGLGIVALPESALLPGNARAPLRGVIDLLPAGCWPERLPEIRPCPSLLSAYGVSVPRLEMNQADPAAEFKLRLAACCDLSSIVLAD